MAGMAAAAAAMHLGARIAEVAVGRGADRAFERRPEARPAGAAVELGLARIERQRAAGADEGAGALFLVERAGDGAFGRRFAQYAILERRQPFFPFGIAELPARLRLGPRRFGEEHPRAADGTAERESAEKITTFDHAGATSDGDAGSQAGVHLLRFARAARINP